MQVQNGYPSLYMKNLCFHLNSINQGCRRGSVG